MIRKADIALGIVLAVLCAAACWYAYSSGSSGTFVTVTVDGEEYGSYPLKQDDVIDIDTKYGHNTLVISGGKARMTEASCPDGYCLGQYEKNGGIDSSNQTIVCLPNRVAISIKADQNASESSGDQPDAVSGTAADGASDHASGSSNNSGKDGDTDAQDGE